MADQSCPSPGGPVGGLRGPHRGSPRHRAWQEGAPAQGSGAPVLGAGDSGAHAAPARQCQTCATLGTQRSLVCRSWRGPLKKEAQRAQGTCPRPHSERVTQSPALGSPALAHSHSDKSSIGSPEWPTGSTSRGHNGRPESWGRTAAGLHWGFLHPWVTRLGSAQGGALEIRSLLLLRGRRDGEERRKGLTGPGTVRGDMESWGQRGLGGALEGIQRPRVQRGRRPF